MTGLTAQPKSCKLGFQVFHCHNSLTSNCTRPKSAATVFADDYLGKVSREWWWWGRHIAALWETLANTNSIPFISQFRVK